MPSEFLPVLDRGKHRSPRRGACFMEFASLLAGERWSDHPRCTHPVLAALARSVNDVTTDESRGELAPLIPDVIGTSVDDPRVAPELAALSCRTALAQVRESHARFVLAVALMAAERMLAGETPGSGEAASSCGLLTAHERDRAGAYVDRFKVSPRFYRRMGARGVVEHAVTSMAAERGPATDRVLHDLLAAAIARYHEIVPTTSGVSRPAVDDPSWAAACDAVGGSSRRR